MERRKEEERNALLFEDENKEATSAADGEDGTRCTLVVDYGGNERKAFKIRKTDPLEVGRKPPLLLNGLMTYAAIGTAWSYHLKLLARY